VVIGNDPGMIRVPLRGLSKAQGAQPGSRSVTIGALRMEFSPDLYDLAARMKPVCRFGGSVETQAAFE